MHEMVERLLQKEVNWPTNSEPGKSVVNFQLILFILSKKDRMNRIDKNTT